MTYRFRPGATLTQNVREVASGQLTEAMTTLAQQPEGLNAAVHDVRKNFKRLRALYRLVRSGDRAFQQTENARIRELGQGLSSLRDAAALVENAVYLRKHIKDEDAVVLMRRVEKALKKRRDRTVNDPVVIEDKLRQAVAGCQDALGAVQAVKFDKNSKHGARILINGWRRTLTQAGALVTQCETSLEDEVFHDLRKRTQDHRMALELLEAVWPSAMIAKHSKAKDLSDMLGHLQDLSVMLDLVETEPDSVGDLTDRGHLISVVMTHRHDLRLRSLKAARTVFGDDPEIESRIVGSLWGSLSASA